MTLQVNLGKLCNQACRHCHVDAGPHQTAADGQHGRATSPMPCSVASMEARRSIDDRRPDRRRPRAEPAFPPVGGRGARERGRPRVMDRCNLSDPAASPARRSWRPSWRSIEVEVVASLPFYRRDRTDRQRGSGRLRRAASKALHLLNSLGYGTGSSGLLLRPGLQPGGHAYLPAAAEQPSKPTTSASCSACSMIACSTGLYCHHEHADQRASSEWLDRKASARAGPTWQKLPRCLQPTAPWIRRHVPRPGVGRARRHAVRLRLQPDAVASRCGERRAAQHPRLRPTCPGESSAATSSTGDHCLGCTAGGGSSCGGSTA